MKLTKKWRKSDRGEPGESGSGERYTLPTRDDFQPLDTLEQLELVSSFERHHARNCRLWRGTFSALLLLYSGFSAYCVFQHFLNPWQLRFHAYFMEDISAGVVTAAGLVAILCCLMAVMGLQAQNSAHNWLWASLFTGFLLAIFWSYYIFRLPKIRWDATWLPLGPLSCALVCLYVERLLAESWEEIKRLRASVYSYKAQ